MSHELVDHTSEVTLRLRAPDFPELLREATRAFAELVPDTLRGPVDSQRRELRLQTTDPVAALVEWLNEVVFLCEADQWLPTELEVTSAGAGEIVMRARGETLGAPFVLVKAATLHAAFVRDYGAGLEAEVTLDI